MKLHLSAEDVGLYLQDHSGRAMQRIPAAAKELLRIKVRVRLADRNSVGECERPTAGLRRGGRRGAGLPHAAARARQLLPALLLAS